MQVYLVLFSVVPLLALEHCCKEKVVAGFKYTLAKVSEGEVHLGFGCLNNCLYHRPGKTNLFCFRRGKYQPKCLDASDHFNTFRLGAEKTSRDAETFFLTKTEEYGKMKNFTSFKDKLLWIKKDIEDVTGQPLIVTSSRDYVKGLLQRVVPSKREKFIKLNTKFDDHEKKILKAFLAHDNPKQVQEALDNMEDELLHQSHDDHEVHQAAHHGVQAAKLAIKLLTNDKQGSSAVDKMLKAIRAHTDHRNKRFLKLCEETVAVGAVGAAAGGCAVGFVVGPEGCLAGAAAGYIGGFAAGVAGCAVEGISDAAGCLATTSQVETTTGLKKISQLAIGDFIRTSSGGLSTYFTEFIGWMDRQQSSPVKMLQVWTSQGVSPLTLTASHIVFTSNSTKYADELLIGDCLFHWNSTDMEEQEVTQILTTFELGYWAPLTMDGTLLVDGYLTSCYASFPHQLSDLAMIPVKAMPSILLDNEESQHRDGVRSVVNKIKRIGEFLGIRKQKRNNKRHLSIDVDTQLLSLISKSEF